MTKEKDRKKKKAIRAKRSGVTESEWLLFYITIYLFSTANLLQPYRLKSLFAVVVQCCKLITKNKLETRRQCWGTHSTTACKWKGKLKIQPSFGKEPRLSQMFTWNYSYGSRVLMLCFSLNSFREKTVDLEVCNRDLETSCYTAWRLRAKQTPSTDTFHFHCRETFRN